MRKGNRFPCFAYATVLAAQLKVAGFRAWVLYFKTKDIETSMSGGGHVVKEVFLDKLQKWVYVYGQFNAMPSLNGIPLNAVEFQTAIKNSFKKLEIKSLEIVNKTGYVNFVNSYLYFLDCSFDQRDGFVVNRNKVNGNKSLMSVLQNAANPKLMLSFGSIKIDHCEYTNLLKDFYAKPE